eukprot:TRINITY_DN2793_c0_g2_i1.p1 TRINITY_DN2793_c0_g2~~TRINITY_DN2793_c0_g2_i1.p1  ORF type:complete len:243 (-),score=65.25 TRINITY_DN2793_c0_g2_i1:104-742(-)
MCIRDRWYQRRVHGDKQKKVPKTHTHITNIKMNAKLIFISFLLVAIAFTQESNFLNLENVEQNLLDELEAIQAGSATLPVQANVPANFPADGLVTVNSKGQKMSDDDAIVADGPHEFRKPNAARVAKGIQKHSTGSTTVKEPNQPVETLRPNTSFIVVLQASSFTSIKIIHAFHFHPFIFELHYLITLAAPNTHREIHQINKPRDFSFSCFY